MVSTGDALGLMPTYAYVSLVAVIAALARISPGECDDLMVPFLTAGPVLSGGVL